MTTTRTDAHAPTNLVTEDYEYIYAADLNEPWALHLGRDFLALLNNVDPADPHPEHSRCSHCGAVLRYVAWLRHVPTGYVITVGETCLENRFDQATAEFHRLRKGAALDRQAQRIRKLRDEFVAANPDLAFLDDKNHEHTNDFVADVARKLRRYGELSERQVDAVRRSIVRDAQRAAERAEREAAEAAINWIPVPIGRSTITGTVLTTKWQESQYGSTLKQLVRVDTPEGSYKLWGTVPRDLEGRNVWDDETNECRVVPGVDRGDVVTFTAAVERSDRDESFGFYKRPTKASFVSRAEVAND